MNLDTKIEVSVGCVNFLTDEVETLRKQNEKLMIEKRIVDRFLTLTESIQPRNSAVGYGTDQMWQAKREIEEAINKKQKQEQEEPKDSPAPPPVSNEFVAQGCEKFN